MGDGVRQTFKLCLVLRLVLCVLTFPIYEDEQLYAGSPCRMAHGKGNGTCVKFENCPSKVQELREGRYDLDQTDRCGFDGDTEIVCCSNFPNITDKSTIISNVSPAEAACQEYGNEVVVTETERSVTFHISNGVDAKYNEFPHMAAIGYATRAEDAAPGTIEYTCGGTLISRQHVLTAAHCVNNGQESVPIEVRLGSTDLTAAEEGTQRVPILSIKSHPGFKRSQNYNDIAIIKLQEPVRLTNSVQPACLMTKPVQNLDANVNQTLVVVGWGATEFIGESSPKLQKGVGLRFVEFDECSKNFENQPKLPNGLDDVTMICATDRNTTRRADTCPGDSGGPLLLSSPSSRPIIAGITAFGKACGGSTPSVYTSVYGYMNWIENEVWPSSERQ